MFRPRFPPNCYDRTEQRARVELVVAKANFPVYLFVSLKHYGSSARYCTPKALILRKVLVSGIAPAALAIDPRLPEPLYKGYTYSVHILDLPPVLSYSLS